MNIPEATRLLTVASGFDRRQVDELTATAWAKALDDRSYPECERAVIAHHKDPLTRGQYLTIGHLLDRVEAGERTARGDVEADVRAAKARGIIPADWPRREPLTPQATFQLAQARDRDRAEAVRFAQVEGPTS